MINLLRKFILDWLFVGDDQSPQQETLPAENIQENGKDDCESLF